jgi:orotate phosphoribosyltransferase-like protein
MTKKPTRSKVETVIALCRRGTTLDAISTKLRVSKTAASSLISDARRKGKRVKCEMGADGVSRYYV